MRYGFQVEFPTCGLIQHFWQNFNILLGLELNKITIFLNYVTNLLVFNAVKKFLEISCLANKVFFRIELLFKEETLVVCSFTDNEKSNDVVGMYLVVV